MQRQRTLVVSVPPGQQAPLVQSVQAGLGLGDRVGPGAVDVDHGHASAPQQASAQAHNHISRDHVQLVRG